MFVLPGSPAANTVLGTSFCVHPSVWSTEMVYVANLFNLLVQQFFVSVIQACANIDITTNIVGFESRSGGVYSIQHYVITFLSDLRQISGFLWVLRFPPPIKLTATIQLKKLLSVALNTTTLTHKHWTWNLTFLGRFYFLKRNYYMFCIFF